MKLELRHLAGYLPYGLKVIENGEDEKIEITGIYSFEDIYTDAGDISFEGFKPILRPLSDFTKEIEVNGEKFVPNTWIYNNIKRDVDIYRPINIDYPLELNIDTEDYSQCVDLYDGFTIVQKLLEWHFDIYGLIEKGLAIDKNTLL